MSELRRLLTRELEHNAGNRYRERFDRRTLEPLPYVQPSLRTRVRRALARLRGSARPSVLPRLVELERTYELLSDDYSREMLVKVLAFRELGHEKYRLPLLNDRVLGEVRDLERIVVGEETEHVPAFDWRLRLFDLTELGWPARLFTHPMNVYVDFVLKQYEYDREGTTIRAEEGETALDFGAYLGDTALYFASRVGPSGRTFSFEFVPSNLRLLRKNVALNPELASRISVVERPVWSEPGRTIYFADRGPASRVSFEPLENATGSVETTTVDGFVEEWGLDRVDFIKMDIEGAEPHALEGARRTLEKHRPKLALAVYHSLDDMIRIPRILDEMGLGYRMYLDHYTIHSEETVLYAIGEES